MISRQMAPAGAPAIVALLLVAIALGAWFRFHDLSRPVVFEDESITWLFLSGTTEADWNHHLFDGREHTAAELATFQNPKPGHGVLATVQALATSEPQHTPLFYAAERAWVGCFGSSLAARRALSATGGLLLIAGLAWLCWEVFEMPLAALVGAALAAVSPMHIAFSQQAREYELWGAFVCLASAALIAAVRRPTVARWAVYALLVSLMLYTHAFSVTVLAAHAVWVALSARKGRRVWLAFAACLATAVLVNMPWILNLALHFSTATDENSWSATAWPLQYFASKWAFNLSATFFDLLYSQTRYAALGAVVLVLELAALILGPRLAKRDAAFFVLCLAGVCAGALVIPDFVAHEHRSTMPRYVLPVFLALEVAVAGFLARALTWPERTARVAGCVTLVAVLAAGITSAWVRSTRDSWWENNKDAAVPAIAANLNAATRPLLIVQSGAFVLELVNTLAPGVRILALSPRAPWPSTTSDQTYLLNPSQALRTRLAAQGAHLVAAPLWTANDASLQAFRLGLRAHVAGGVAEDAPGAAALWRIR